MRFACGVGREPTGQFTTKRDVRVQQVVITKNTNGLCYLGRMPQGRQVDKVQAPRLREPRQRRARGGHEYADVMSVRDQA
jgi:hypothetical protein